MYLVSYLLCSDYFLCGDSFLLTRILGNVATTLWFFPGLFVWLQRVRGVNIKRGARIFVSAGVVIDNEYPSNVWLGDDVWLTRGVIILAHGHSSRLQAEVKSSRKIGDVRIGDGVFIGVNSVILPGVELGKGVYVGAGSVVTKSVPDHSVVAGNPARVVRSLRV